MIRAFASCRLFGNSFSPKELLKKLPGINFRDSHEPGDVFRYTKRSLNRGGKIIDRPSKRTLTYGGAIIDHPSNLNKPGDKIEWEDMLAFLIKHHQTMRECGVEDITLTLIFFYQGDGASWHIEDKDIKLLAELGIGLSIDWYQIEDESVYPEHLREDEEVEYAGDD